MSDNERKMEEANAVELLKDLTDVFKHRHRFYWSTYYKLMFYHLAIAALPYVAYHFLKAYNFIANEQSYMVSLLVIFAWLLLVINVWLILRSRKYLEGEDLRLRIVHKAVREMYMREFAINLYPGLDLLEADYQCQSENNNNKILASSLGGYMESLFVTFLVLISAMGTLLFTFLAYTLLF